MTNKIELNILVLIENMQSLRQTMTWFNLLGHHTTSCNERSLFLDELTKSDVEYDLVFVDVANNNLITTLENIQLSKALNIYDVDKKKAKYILYGDANLSSVYKDAIRDAQAAFIPHTKNQIEFFEALSNALELPRGTGEVWNTKLDEKLKNGTTNVVTLRLI